MTTFDLTIGSDELRRLVASSIELMERYQDRSGAFVACPTFPVYRFSWFRDGAFIADALSRSGRPENARRFFDWCGRVMERRRGRVEGLLEDRAAGRTIERSRFLPCRYRADGTEERGDWWDFQLDGYGTWLWSAAAHARRHGASLGRWAGAIETTVEYLAAFWDEPCFDWWEERPEERHTSTLAAIVGGLEAVAQAGVLDEELADRALRAASSARASVLEQAVVDDRFGKWLGSTELDASLVACATPFRLVSPDDPRMVATISALEHELAHGGVHRYPTDTYYGGGEWLLLAAMLGWHYAEVGRREEALGQLHWVAACADREGRLPEQVNGHLLAPEREAEWIERWGPSASPLLWSHAMFVTLATELGLVDAGESG
jgi:GH15 family glucan-1,4-alpha-glucosidase